jgi:serine protease
LLSTVLVLTACASWLPGDARLHAHRKTPQHTDRMIIKYRRLADTERMDDAALGTVESAASAAQARVRHVRRTGSGSHIMKMDRLISMVRMRQMAAELRASDPDIEYAEPDRIMTIQFEPDDPAYPLQWHYREAAGGLNLPAAWDLSTGAGITVAVIDTGYRPHVDLVANIAPGYDFITSPLVSNDGEGRDAIAIDPGDGVDANECGSGTPAHDSSWHGTHVAGTIAAVSNNGAGVSGVAPGARVQPVRALGRCGGFTSDIADAIIWAAGGRVPGVPANANPARVINMSLGGEGVCDRTTQLAINFARSRGTVVVVAAGNAGADAADYSPASCEGVISVGAVGRNGAPAYYSNFGTRVDVSAPGGDLRAEPGTGGIYSTFNSGRRAAGVDNYAYRQGTSMAAPHVAGLVALMLARNPGLTPDTVRALLRASTRPLSQPCPQGCGSGIVDARAAVQAAINLVPSPPPVTPPPPATSPAQPQAPAHPPATPTQPPAPAPARTIKETERNGRIGLAQPVTAPAIIQGSLASPADTDYYSIAVPAGKRIEAELTSSSDSDYDLYAYNAAGELIATSRMGMGQVDQVTLDNSGSDQPVQAFLRVVYVSGGVGAKAGRYRLTLHP